MSENIIDILFEYEICYSCGGKGKEPVRYKTGKRRGQPRPGLERECFSCGGSGKSSYRRISDEGKKLLEFIEDNMEIEIDDGMIRLVTRSLF